MVIIGAERRILNQEEVLAIAQTFKLKLAKEMAKIDQLYLFGSYATKSAGPDSDIDLAVITSVSVPIDQETIDRWRLWAKEINVKTEVHVVRAEDFANKYLSLPFYIKKEGLII